MKKKISKQDNIAQLVMENPGAADLLAEYGLHCAHCSIAQFDTLEEGAKIHGLDDEEIDEMIEELSKIGKKED